MRAGVIAVALAWLALPHPVDADAVHERLPTCLACHGETGQSENPEVPSLGAQTAAYSLVQLYMFREKLRQVELMNEMAKGLSDDDLRMLSDTISKLPPPHPVNDTPDAARMARAQDLIAKNRCNSCHAPNFAGQDQVPRLAAQREDYLLRTLRQYKSGERRGYDPTMASVVEPLKDEDFVDLAYYLARVK
jgi:cytochrome c553